MTQTVCEPSPDPLSVELDAARAEIAGLRRSVESYQGILTRMEVGTVFHAPDTTIQYSNAEASEILGLSAEQMAGKAAIDPAWQFVTEDGSPLTVDEYPVNRVVSSLEPFGACVLGVDRPVTDDRVWVQVRAIPEFGLQRELCRVVVTFSNITERKRAEDALRRSEEKYRGLFRDAAIGIFHSTFDGRFLDVNPALAKLLGYDSPEEVVSSITNINEQVYADPCRRESVGRSARDAGGLFTTENRYRRKDGTFWDGRVHLRVVRDLQGNPTHYEGFIEDFTQRKLTEIALRESEARYQRIVETANSGIWVMDRELRTTFVNGCMAQMLGCTPEAIIGRPVEEFMLAEDLSFYREHLVLRQDEKKGNVQQQFLRSDNSTVWTLVSATAITDAMGKFDGAIAMFTDITERKRMEAEKAKLQIQLNQSQKMESVGRLAGGVAHDFNNMLGVILGHAEMALEQMTAAEPLYGVFGEIKSAAERSANLTRQLLAFARKQTVAPKALNLNETVESMLKMLRRLIGEDIELVFLPGEALYRVKIDPSQIDQILANLCVNARDAIGGVGKLTIETSNCSFDDAYCSVHTEAIRGEYVKLAVSDDGCGMDRATQERLFEPFFTTKGVGEGTGLGLATVYGIVKQNDGVINVQSELDQGTTFAIYLPRHAAEGTVVAPSEAPEASVARRHETILVVEDEPAVLKMIRRMLERSGYTVLTASTPGEAIQLAYTHASTIHLLLTDVIMPAMNGHDLATKLLAFYPSLKRLYMSGYTAEVIAHHGVLEEGVHFIGKPFSKQDLEAKVSEALEGG